MTAEESEMQLLLKERGATSNSLRMADDYLEYRFQSFMIDSQASESHSLLVNQRNRLSMNRSRIGGMLSRFPVVNNLMNSIKDRRNRDK